MVSMSNIKEKIEGLINPEEIIETAKSFDLLDRIEKN